MAAGKLDVSLKLFCIPLHKSDSVLLQIVSDSQATAHILFLLLL